MYSLAHTLYSWHDIIEIWLASRLDTHVNVVNSSWHQPCQRKPESTLFLSAHRSSIYPSQYMAHWSNGVSWALFEVSSWLPAFTAPEQRPQHLAVHLTLVPNPAVKPIPERTEVYVGWTGMASASSLAHFNAGQAADGGFETIEIDPQYAQALGLAQGALVWEIHFVQTLPIL